MQIHLQAERIVQFPLQTYTVRRRTTLPVTRGS